MADAEILSLHGGERVEGRDSGGDRSFLEPALGPRQHRHLLLRGEQHVKAARPVDIEGGVEPGQGARPVGGARWTRSTQRVNRHRHIGPGDSTSTA